MTILIVTHSEDNASPDLVEEAIRARGGRVFRLDTDRFPTDLRLSIHQDRAGRRARIEGDRGSLDLREVTAVYTRRLRAGHGIPESLDPQMRAPSVAESRAVMLGMIASLDVFHLDRLSAVRNAEHKLLQLEIARAVGLDTPRTLTGNDPEAVRAFAESCPQGMVTKMQHGFAVHENGETQVVFTSAVKSEDLEDLEGLRYCPMTFQERIEKALELRAIVVGQRVFTAAVDSTSRAGAEIDWRRQGHDLLDAWQHHRLPAEVERSLLALMDRLGLAYGACDFILTPEGRYVFLEVNPGGEFLWLEQAPGLPVSGALADLLLDRARRPGCAPGGV
jgi:glutathione synthase/RimK-type ligase-like ATP-grasp enzyme